MISGSRTDLLLKCPGPGCYAHVEEARADGLDEEGAAVHNFLSDFEMPAGAAALGGTSLAEQRDKALARVRQAHRARCESLDLEALAPYLVANFQREQGYWYNPRTGAGGQLPKGSRAEAYKAVPVDEQGRPLVLPVTPDRVGLSGGTLVLIEWKGRNPDHDKTRLQMLTQAVAVRAACEATTGFAMLPGAAVAFCIRLDDEGNAHTWRWDFSAADLDAHADALHDAWEAVLEGRRRMAAGGEPTLRAGGHCVYCPARFHCPAWSGPSRRLGLETADIIADTLAEAGWLGRAYEAASLLKSYAVEVMERIRAEAEQAPVPLPDGKELRAEPEVDELDVEVALNAVPWAVHEMADGTEDERTGVANSARDALAASVRRVLPVKGVEDAMRAVAPKRKLGAWTDEAMAKIEAAGGVKRKPVVRARTPKGE